MPRFILFFRGDVSLPKDQASYDAAWNAWLQNLKDSGTLLDYGKLTHGKIVSDTVKEFHFDPKENARGFAILQAASLDDVIALAQTCPIIGIKGNVTIRPMEG